MPMSKDPEKRARQMANLTSQGFKGNTERASKAGVKSQQAQSKKRSLRELANLMNEMDVKGSDGKPVINPATGEPMKEKERDLVKIRQLMREGNLEAIKYWHKLTGDAPDETKNVNITGNLSTEGEMIIGFLDSADEEE